MMTHTETPESAQATAPAKDEQPSKTPVARRKPKSALSKAKSGKKITHSKKAAKARSKSEGPRPGSKSAKVLELLKRPDGATLLQLRKATGWQAHSVRGFLSVRKKMGWKIASTKSKDGERVYRLAK